MPVVIDGTNGITTPDLESSGPVVGTTGTLTALTVNSNNISAVNSLGFRNRIINGDMRIDQRNAGASVTPTASGYTLDRWLAALTQPSKFSVEQTVTGIAAPVGFTDYLATTSSSAYSVAAGDFFLIRQYIEGFNFADLAWGTASAQSITLSFWVRSSLTGTFGGSLQNSAENRSYPFTYTISAANTWEQKTITIAGDTSGTWIGSTNGVGLRIALGLGVGSTYSGTAGAWAGADYRGATGAVSVVGTNGATFYITGVQLEAGSVASPFERVNYTGQLAMCQRYYYRVNAVAGARVGGGHNSLTTQAVINVPFQVAMRAAPTALEQSGTAGDYDIQYLSGVAVCSSVPTFLTANQFMSTTIFSVASGLTAGQGSSARSVNTSGYLGWSAEL